MWAFDQRDLFRLELGHRVNNPASCSVALNAGFAAEGIERHKFTYDYERFYVETDARLRSDPALEIALLKTRWAFPPASYDAPYFSSVSHFQYLAAHGICDR